MPASEQFSKDLELCEAGLKELLNTLEKELAMNGAKAVARHEAKRHVPPIVRPAETHHSICQAAHMRGKTVERVEFETREPVENAHGTEVLIIHFTDGSILSVDTRWNVGILADELPSCPTALRLQATAGAPAGFQGRRQKAEGGWGSLKSEG